MKNRYFLSGLGALIFSMPVAHAQQPINPFAHSAKASYAIQSPELTKLMKEAVEIPSKRTLHSSMYKTHDGRIISRSSKQLMNYPDANGNLQPINTNLHANSKGWAADQQPNPCYFRSDRSTAITLGVGVDELDFNINSSINGSAYDENITSLDKNIVSLNLTTGISKKITFGVNGIETDYIIDKSIGDEISISEGIRYPNGYKLVRDETIGKSSKDGWTGDYMLLSEKDNSEAARFYAPLCYDSKGSWCVGSYSTKIKDGKTVLITTVPSDWLSKAVYPIVVDPLITGRTAKWTGGNIPSCVFPRFSDDSILVTIPAKVTITRFFINYAYWTSPYVPVYWPDGKFYFSTSCRNTPSDTLSCDQTLYEESHSGYCFLDTIGNDFHQYYTCCYAPKCDSQNFYLSVHLARMAGGVGCDTNFVMYDHLINDQWYCQFMATIIGNTVQPDSTDPLIVTPGTQCSDVCTLQMTVNANYGVPPYKISHPWDSTKYTVGANASCNTIGSARMTLTIPGCPTYCGTTNVITVPPPLVIDACGDTATGWPVEKVTINPTPKITAAPDTVTVCNGTPLKYTLTSCIPGTTISWTGSNNSSGTGNINNIAIDTSLSNSSTVYYKITGTANGCASNNDSVVGIVYPYPIVTVRGTDTIQISASTNLTATGGGTYSWSPSAGLSCTNCPNPIASPPVTTVYTVTVTNKDGCSWDDSIRIVVLQDQIIVPNVITPNGDGINDLLVIKGLQYYPNSSIAIYDRWGKEVYSSPDYANNWDGGNQSDGIYYYILTVNTGKKYKGYLQIIK